MPAILLMQWLREPLVQFLVLGALIYLGYGLFGASDDAADDLTVRVSEDRIASLSAMWEKRWNRAPTEEELVGLVRAYVRESILYREAVAMGLDTDDHIIRRRLAQKLEFLTNDIARLQEPGEADLQAYFEANRQQFREPDRVTFVHVFFNPDTRGEATLTDAEAALARLQAAGEPDPAALTDGDRFMLRDYFSAATEMEVRRDLGSGFAASVMELPAGDWQGPVLSGFGTHLVYVYEHVAAPEPELAAVRDAVAAEWLRTRTEEFNAEYLDSLKQRYEVVIEAPPAFAEAVLDDSPQAEVRIPDGGPAS